MNSVEFNFQVQPFGLQQSKRKRMNMNSKHFFSRLCLIGRLVVPKTEAWMARHKVSHMHIITHGNVD